MTGPAGAGRDHRAGQPRSSAPAAGDVRLRPGRPGDAQDLAGVFFASVREAALADYSIEQVQAWAPERPDDSWFADRMNDGRLLLVAVDADDHVVAYADLEDDGHIDHLYCLPTFVGRGVGSALYDAIETEARARGIGRLFVEASEGARRLFQRKGFRVVRRNELVRHGVALHNFDMDKPLDAG